MEQRFLNFCFTSPGLEFFPDRRHTFIVPESAHNSQLNPGDGIWVDLHRECRAADVVRREKKFLSDLQQFTGGKGNLLWLAIDENSERFTERFQRIHFFTFSFCHGHSKIIISKRAHNMVNTRVELLILLIQAKLDFFLCLYDKICGPTISFRST